MGGTAASQTSNKFRCLERKNKSLLSVSIKCAEIKFANFCFRVQNFSSKCRITYYNFIRDFYSLLPRILVQFLTHILFNVHLFCLYSLLLNRFSARSPSSLNSFLLNRFFLYEVHVCFKMLMLYIILSFMHYNT